MLESATEPKMNQVVPYQISEVARQAKVSLRTVRFYQQKGLIIPSFRTSGGMRLYSQSDVNRVKLIRRLRNTGMNLEQIKAVLNPDNDSDRKAKVEHTLKVLTLEAENARRRIIELKQQSREREKIISLIRKCLDCEMGSCPEECPPRAHIIQ